MSESDLGRRLQAAEEFVKKIPQPFPSTLTGPSAVKKFFSKQEEALQFAASFDQDMSVFAFETAALGETGARRFLAATPECFLHEYKQLDDRYKHYYEVIPSGRPCRLYCDLEFSRPDNADLDGEAMTKDFVELLLSALNRVFHVAVEEAEVIVLDSSSEEKFSKHLIFASDAAAFVNNVEMGWFVRAVHAAAAEEAADARCAACSAVVGALSGLPARSLSVRRCRRPPTAFADLGVYTRNRNFRLLHSSKLGRRAVLRPDPRWPCPLARDQLFLRSLVCRVGRHARPLSHPCACPRPGGSGSGGGVAGSGGGAAGSGSGAAMGGLPPSPYVEVEAWVSSELLQGRGRVRRWSYFPERESLALHIADNRFCRNVGREHRSNNVVYVVDVRRRLCYQKCLDPDCQQQGFRSEEWPLPPGLLPWDALMEEEEEEMLTTALDRVEKAMRKSS